MSMTRKFAPISGLRLAPHINFASESSLELTYSMTSLASSRLISFPPTMFTRAPEDPSMSISSRGLFIAFSIASFALCLLSDSPTPIIATPAFVITVLISAKSTLTRPGEVMSSVIPFTAFVRISSATLNAV